MTIPDDLTGLFREDKEASRIVVSVKEVEARFEETGMVALTARILAPETLEPTEVQLLVQMLPADAYSFARAVDETAHRKAWKFPANAEFVEWQGEKNKD